MATKIMGNIKNFEWYRLLNIAIEILNHVNIKKELWSFGGGSSIEYYFNHRKSKDVDIFLKDIQLITYVTPRLNNFAEKYAEDYIEQSNFVKIYFNKSEIDFIVSPKLTELSPEFYKNDIAFYIEHPVETILKKLFYRCDSLKIRDFFDLFVVEKEFNEIWNYIKKIIPEAKLKLIINRIDFLISQKEEDFNNSLINLSINFKKYNFSKKHLQELKAKL